MGRGLTAIVRARTLFASLAIALTLISFYGLSLQEYEDSFRKMFQADSLEYKDYEELLAEFGSAENSCQLLIESDRLLSRDSVLAIRDIHAALVDCEGVTNVYSICSLRQQKRVGRYLLPLFGAESDSNDAAFQTSVSVLREHPLARGHLLSEDGTATLIVIELGDDDLSVAEIAAHVASIQAIVNRRTSGVPLKSMLTGQPCLRLEIVESVQRDQMVFSLVAVTLVTLVAWVFFRNLVALAIVAIPPILGAIWTVGLMGLAGEHLNVLNVVVPNMLLVIGFSDSVHLLFDFRREIRAGAAPLDGAKRALTQVGPACVLTSITTAIGFGSLVMAEDDLIQRFGVTCAVGTLLTMVAVLTVVPILVSTRLGKLCGTHAASFLEPANEGWISRFIDWVLRRRGVVVGAGIVATIFLLLGTLWLAPDFRYTENLPDSSPALQGFRRCDQLFAGAGMVHVVVQLPEEQRLGATRSQRMLEDIHAVIDASPIVHYPMSILNLLQSLPGDDAAPFSRTSELRYVSADVRARFYDTKESRWLVSAKVPDVGSARLQIAFDHLRKALKNVEASYSGVHLKLTGLPVMSTYRSQMMIGDLARSLGLAALLIFVVIAVAMRSWRLGLISVIPNLFPLAALAASLVILGLPLRYSGVLCFCICLGIAVDDTIHFLTRYKHEFDKGQGAVKASRQTFIVMAPVLITTTTLMVIGFGVTAFSGVPTIRQFGLLGSAALIWAFVADLLLLPALLALGGKPNLDV